MDEFLQRKNIRTCRYQGDMGISDREQTLKILKKSKKCRVMLRTHFPLESMPRIPWLTEYQFRSLSQVWWRRSVSVGLCTRANIPFAHASLAAAP